MRSLVFFFASLWTSVSISAEIVQVSDGFDASQLDVSLWEPVLLGSGVSASQSDGRYRIEVASNASGAQIRGGLKSTQILSGYFDIRIDYYLDEWPSTNGLRVGFDLFELDDLNAGVMGMIRFGRGIPIDSPGRPSQAYITGAEGAAPGASVPTTDLSGRLRMVRVDDTVAAYYAPIATEDWRQLDQYDVPFEDLILTVQAFTGDNVFSHTSSMVSFDNFSLTTTVPEPSLAAICIALLGVAPTRSLRYQAEVEV